MGQQAHTLLIHFSQIKQVARYDSWKSRVLSFSSVHHSICKGHIIRPSRLRSLGHMPSQYCRTPMQGKIRAWFKEQDRAGYIAHVPRSCLEGKLYLLRVRKTAWNLSCPIFTMPRGSFTLGNLNQALSQQITACQYLRVSGTLSLCLSLVVG